MKSYQVGYEKLRAQGTEVIAISMDTDRLQAQFKEKTKSQYRFVGDPEGRLVDLFGLRGFLLPASKRKTLVIGPGRSIKKIISGVFAASAGGAVDAVCNL